MGYKIFVIFNFIYIHCLFYFSKISKSSQQQK